MGDGGSWALLSRAEIQRFLVSSWAIAAQAPGGFQDRGWPSGLRVRHRVVTYLGRLVGLRERSSLSGGARSDWALLRSDGSQPSSISSRTEASRSPESALERAGIAPSLSVTVGHLSKHVPGNTALSCARRGCHFPLSWCRSVISIRDIVMAVDRTSSRGAMRAPALARSGCNARTLAAIRTAAVSDPGPALPKAAQSSEVDDPCLAIDAAAKHARSVDR